MLSISFIYKCSFTTCFFLLNSILETFMFTSSNGILSQTNLGKGRQEFIGPHNWKSVIGSGPAVRRVLLSVLRYSSSSSSFGSVFLLVPFSVWLIPLVARWLLTILGLFFTTPPEKRAFISQQFQQKPWNWVSLARNGLAWVTCPQTNHCGLEYVIHKTVFPGLLPGTIPPKMHVRPGRGAPWKMHYQKRGSKGWEVRTTEVCFTVSLNGWLLNI